MSSTTRNVHRHPAVSALSSRLARAARALLVVGLLGSLLALGAPQPTAAAAGECGCTGEFGAPKVAKAKVAGAAAPDEDTGNSKTGRYRVVNEYDEDTQSGQMRVVRVADDTELLTFPVDGSVNGWGFSPDEDRFVTYGHSSAAMYDLAGGGTEVLRLDRPATIGFSPKGTYALAVWPEGATPYASVHVAATGENLRVGGSDRLRDSQYLGFSPDDTTIFVENVQAGTSSLYSLPSAQRIYDRAGAPSTVGYSPDGKHVSVAVLDGGSVHVTIVRTADGHQVYETTFDAIAPPIISEPEEKTGKLKLDPQEAGGLGFSPDGTSYIVGTSDGSTARVTVVDLARGIEVLEFYDISGTANWQFSPCGHMFALTTSATPASPSRVQIHSTHDGSLMGEATTPAGSVTVKATADDLVVEHEPDGGSESTVLGPNLACAVYTLTLPATIEGGASATGTLSLDRPAPPGGMPIALSTDSTHLSVPATVTVPAGQTTVPVAITSTSPAEDTDVTVTFKATGRYSGEPVELTVRLTGNRIYGLYLEDYGVRAGESTTGSVLLWRFAPAGGAVIALSSDSPDVQVPATVTVPEGTGRVAFDVTTSEVDDPTSATITATYGASIDTVTLDLETPIRTTTELLAVPGPTVVAGTPVTLTARVTVEVPDDGDTYPGPTGTLTFTNGVAPIDAVEIDGGWGQTEVEVEVVTDPLWTGTHDIEVRYSGSEEYRPSSARARLTVVPGLYWNGEGDGRSWSDPRNWGADRAPIPGDHVTIAVADPTELVVDVADLRLEHLALAGPVHLTGEDLVLLDTLSAAGGVRIDNDVELAAGARPINVAGRLQLRGTLSGTGGPAFSGGVVDLAGEGNGYLGLTTIAARTEVRLLAADALGSSATGTDVSGTLCVGPYGAVDEPLTVRGGTISACTLPLDEMSPEELDELERLWEAGHEFVATVSGPVEIDGGLRLSCPTEGDAWVDALVIDGPISGDGDVQICSGAVEFGGTSANTYSGRTIVGLPGIDGDGADTELVLAKPDGVLAVPGDLSGYDVTITASGQLSSTADLSLRRLHLGTVATAVRSADLRRLVVGTAGDAVGRLDVAGDAAVSAVEVDAAEDAVPGTTHVVVSKASSGPLGDCPANAIVGGSTVVDLRVSCTGGDGNDLTLAAVWHTTVALEVDPSDTSPANGDVTVTITVTSPPGAPVATGQVNLMNHWWDRWAWEERAQLATLDLVDGRASTTFDGDDLGLRAGFLPVYLGSSTHGGTAAPMLRYPLWNVRATSLLDAPTDLTASPWHDDRSVYLEWNPPAVPQRDIVAFHVDVSASTGEEWTESTAVMWDDFARSYENYQAFGFYRVTDLEPGVTYTFRLRAINTLGSSDASDPVIVTIEGPDEDGDDDDGDDEEEEEPATAPDAPTGVTASAGPGQATVRWSAPADDGGSPVLRYVITPHADGRALDPVTTPGAALSYTVGGLEPGIAHTFTVAAVNAQGTGATSAPSEPVTPTAPEVVRTAPTAPRAVSTQVDPSDGTQVEVRWDEPSDDGGTPITSYRVEVRQWRWNALTWEVFEGPWNPHVVDGDARSLSLDLAPIRSPWREGYYRIRVVAINDVAAGPWSDEVRVDAVYEPDATVPVTPGPDLPPPPPPSDGDLSNQTGGSAGASSLGPGGSTDVTAAGFEPGEPVRVELHSTPVHLRDSLADDQGVVTTRITIPVDTEPGEHTIHLIGLRSGVHVAIPIQVVAAQVPAQALDSLPVTGSDSTGLALAGWALLAAGLVLVGATGRRRSHTP